MGIMISRRCMRIVGMVKVGFRRRAFGEGYGNVVECRWLEGGTRARVRLGLDYISIQGVEKWNGKNMKTIEVYLLTTSTASKIALFFLTNVCKFVN